MHSNKYLIPVHYILPFILLFTISCSQEKTEREDAKSAAGTFNLEEIQDSTHIVGAATGLSGPEAVRYDPEQDVFFVANFNGDVQADSNGFISKVAPDGTVQELEFMTGTDEYPLHAPRGMFITGDILWACDADGIHGFNRTTGEQVSFTDFTSFEPGFLNDIVAGPDGALYVTDTGASRLYRIANTNVSIVADSLPHPPNGITLDAEGERVILAPWNEARTFYAWVPSDSTLEEVSTFNSGGNFDGIEIVEGSWVVASQVDSSIHISGDNSGIAIKTPGRPADIGIDTKRNQIAVPYIDLNRVDIWALPLETE